MPYSPLNLRYDPKKGFLLTVKVAFNQRAYKFKLKDMNYKDHVCQAVCEKWSNNYSLIPELKVACNAFFENNKKQQSLSSLHQSEIPFLVKVLEDPLSGVYRPRFLYLLRLFKKEQRPIPIYIKKGNLIPSHVASGFFRRFWGIFIYRRLVSIGYNWSKNYPGYSVIKQYNNIHILHSIAAHEFGHLFGIGDAYAVWYRFYYPAPKTENYMMHYNKKVNPQEIAMLIQAFSTNRIQFFPIKFKWKNVKRGFASGVKSFSKKLKKR